MRPYFTILRDSFHEALASRVLWTILIVITVLLLFLAPLAPTGLTGPEFAATELFSPADLSETILKQSKSGAPTVGKRIVSLLPKDSAARLEKISQTQVSASATVDTGPGSDASWLAEQLNGLIRNRDFFDAESWKKVRLRSEAKKLREEGLDKLSAAEHARFNRLALEAVYQGKVAMLNNREERLTYFGIVLEIIPAAKRADFQRAIGGLIFLMLKFGIGVGGVLAGLFVTSTIMPQTFEAGAVDLLFSKPVTRTGVYLTKFVGGCAFVVIMATYFIGGIWALAGLRFGMWNSGLIATIPIFVFIFAVYYSVSCFAGAYWRNPIVAVTMAAMVWLAGWFFTGLTELGDAYVLNPLRIIKVTSAGDTAIVNTQKGEVRRWDAASRDWTQVFRPDKVITVGMGITIPTAYAGPIYDPPNKRIVAMERVIPEFGQYASQDPKIWVGDAKDDFVRKPAVDLGAEEFNSRLLLREPSGSFLVVARHGVRRWDGNVKAEAPKIGNFSITDYLPSADASKLTSVGPEIEYAEHYTAAIHPTAGELALLDEEALRICRRDEDGKFAVRTETTLELSEVGVLAFAGDSILIAQPDGKLLAFNSADGKPREPLALPGGTRTNTLFAAPDGKTFFILAKNSYVYAYSPADHSVRAADIAGQGSVGAINVNERNELLVADRVDRVRVYSIADGKGMTTYQPSRSWLRIANDFLVYPVYRLIPKPHQLDALTISMIQDLEQTPPGSAARDTDLNAPEETSRWTPVRDNAIFILVMLTLGCLHVARRDY